jgi:hypothetical protein
MGENKIYEIEGVSVNDQFMESLIEYVELGFSIVLDSAKKNGGGAVLRQRYYQEIS